MYPNRRIQKRRKKLKCYRFGDEQHLTNKCPFKSKECYACKKTGHVKRICKAQEKGVGGRSINVVSAEEEIENSDDASSYMDC